MLAEAGFHYPAAIVLPLTTGWDRHSRLAWGFFPRQFVLLFLLYFNYVKTYIEFPCVLGVHIRVLKVNYEWICLLVWILFLCIQCFYSISQLLKTTITFWRKVFPVQFWMCHEELTWTKDCVLLKDCENCSPVFKTSPIFCLKLWATDLEKKSFRCNVFFLYVLYYCCIGTGQWKLKNPIFVCCMVARKASLSYSEIFFSLF